MDRPVLADREMQPREDQPTESEESGTESKDPVVIMTDPFTRQDLITAQKEDEELQPLLEAASDPESDYMVDNAINRNPMKIVVPEILKNKIFMGNQAILAVRRQEGISSPTWDRKRQPQQPIPVIIRPWKKLAMDIVGPLTTITTGYCTRDTNFQSQKSNRRARDRTAKRVLEAVAEQDAAGTTGCWRDRLAGQRKRQVLPRQEKESSGLSNVTRRLCSLSGTEEEERTVSKMGRSISSSQEIGQPGKGRTRKRHWNALKRCISQK